MELTKSIEVVNIFNERVEIKPIEYSVALKAITLRKELNMLTNKAFEILRSKYDGNINSFYEEELKKLLELSDEMEKEENELREKHNYYYMGIDNLREEDKRSIIEKYGAMS